MTNDMKQFNVEEFISNEETPVVRRDGKPVRVLAIDIKGSIPRVVYAYSSYDSDAMCEYENVLVVDAHNGRTYGKTDLDSDLYFAPKKYKGWVNIFKDNDGETYIDGCIYANSTLAKEESKKTNCKLIDTIQIRWEE